MVCPWAFQWDPPLRPSFFTGLWPWGWNPISIRHADGVPLVCPRRATGGSPLLPPPQYWAVALGLERHQHKARAWRAHGKPLVCLTPGPPLARACGPVPPWGPGPEALRRGLPRPC